LRTAVTAIGGLLPLALGGSALYSPLAWVIIGGLVSSTLLTLLIIPVVYSLLDPLSEWMRRKVLAPRDGYAPAIDEPRDE
ncbi:MAG: efflux RND transporter permease subunit, partial [Planctomycetota bacterium]|nr:efflux RND transporter permease subunit [Planctomycetota bacterium]